MIFFTYLISLSTIKAGKNFIKKLFAFAGGLSFVMGLFWVQKSTLLFIT